MQVLYSFFVLVFPLFRFLFLLSPLPPPLSPPLSLLFLFILLPTEVCSRFSSMHTKFYKHDRLGTSAQCAEWSEFAFQYFSEL